MSHTGQDGRAAWESPPPPPPPPPAPTPVERHAAVAVRGLSKRFGTTQAVDRFDLDVPNGSFFGLLGPNGAGKTTALRMITGLLRPDAGRVMVGGIDVWDRPEAVKARIGVLPEDLRLFERLRGRELLTYTGLLRGMAEPVVAERAEQLLVLLDLAGAADEFVVDYSHGMRKKIALAAALLHGPALLFLDEPFEAVDPVSGRAIRTVLRGFTARGGTVVISSHVMTLVEQLCDHVAIVHAGRVVAAGPREELAGGRQWTEIVIAVFAVAWVVWLVVPLLLFASDDTLDPRKFALLPLRPRQLVPGLLLGALVGIGPIATLLGAGGAAAGTWRSTGSVAAGATAATAVVLFVLACVASSRALVALVADVLGSRRGRDVATLLAAVLGVGVFSLSQVLPRLGAGTLPHQPLERVAAVGRWTPGGFAGAAVGAANDGALVGAWLRLVALAAWIVAMLALWILALRRIHTTTPHQAATSSGRAGLYPRPLAWLPRSRMTVVAVRFLRGLLRDPVVRGQVLSQGFIVVPMFAIAITSSGGGSAPAIAVFVVVPFGLIAANQIGLDGPALWQHALAGEDLRSDLLGRDLALAVLGLPAATLVALVLAAVFGSWSLLPAVLVLAVATLMTLLGVSNAAAVVAPYPVPEDASNPFAANSGSMGTGCLQGLLVLVTMLVQVVVSVPVILAAALPERPVMRAVAALLALLYGAAVLAGGTALGVARGSRRGPELLAAIEPRAR